MITPIDADQVFVETYLKHEGDEAAALIAYRRAGFIEPEYPIVVAASRHLARLKPEIDAARGVVKSLVRADRSRDSLLTDLDKVFESALADKDHAACVNAKRLQAQIDGLLVEDVRVTHKVDVTMMTDEQLLKIINSKPVVDGEFRDVTPRKGIGRIAPPDGTQAPESRAGS